MKHVQETVPNEAVAYAFGHTECWLEILAQSISCPKRELTDRVGILLQSQGQRVGEEMRDVRGYPPSVDQRLRKVEVVSGARGKLRRTTSLKGKKWSEISSKPHWTQTPAGRKKIKKISADRWRKQQMGIVPKRAAEIGGGPVSMLSEATHRGCITCLI